MPESLGGEIVLPPGQVCDTCNEYIGREIEQPALNTPLLLFLRSSLGVPNKDKKQRLYSGFLFNVEGRFPEESVICLSPEKLAYARKYGRGRLTIPIVGQASICRLMLKMGLEYLAGSPVYDAHGPDFDAARNAVRAPKRRTRWPIALGRLRLEDTIVGVNEDPNAVIFKELVYDIKLALEPERTMIGLYFSYSWATFVVPLNNNNLDWFTGIVDNHNASHLSDYAFAVEYPDLTSN